MTTVFETFEGLLVELWSSPECRSLTDHPVETIDEAVLRYRETVLDIVGDGLDVVEPEPPASIDIAATLMKQYVGPWGGVYDTKRCGEIISAIRSADDEGWREQLHESLGQLGGSRRPPAVVRAVQRFISAEPHAELGGSTYLEWTRMVWGRWQGRRIEVIDIDELVRDLDVLATDETTRLPGLGIDRATSFLADLDLQCFCRIDQTIMPVLSSIFFDDDPRSVFRSFVAMTKEESRRIGDRRRWQWLPPGGLSPQLLEKVVRLYVTDDLHLPGYGNRQGMRERIQRARRALVRSEIIRSRYFGRWTGSVFEPINAHDERH